MAKKVKKAKAKSKITEAEIQAGENAAKKFEGAIASMIPEGFQRNGVVSILLAADRGINQSDETRAMRGKTAFLKYVASAGQSGQVTDKQASDIVALVLAAVAKLRPAKAKEKKKPKAAKKK
jgi:hypothetical protein